MPKGVYKHEHSPWNKGKSGYKTKTFNLFVGVVIQKSTIK